MIEVSGVEAGAARRPSVVSSSPRPPRPRGSGGLNRRWIVPASVLPLLVALVRVVADRHATFLNGDFALLHLDSLRAGQWRQLVGPYDRFGWSHPGPLDAYLLAGGNVLVGAGHALQGQAATTLVVNATAVAGAVHVARRIGGWAAAGATAVTCAVLMVTLGNDIVLNPWTPLVIIAPLVLLGLLSAASALGSSTSLAASGLVATYVVQTDVASLPYAAVLLGVGGGGWVLARRRQVGRDSITARSSSVLPAAGLVTVAVVCWLPPLLQQLLGSSGNLGHIVSFFLSAHHRDGLARGLRSAGLGEWQATGYHHPAVLSSSWGLLATAAAAGLGAALVILGRLRRDRLAALLGAIWLIGTAVAVVAGADVVGLPYWYVMIWASAAAAVGVVGWLAFGLRLLPPWAGAPGAVLVAVILLLVTVQVGRRPEISTYSSRPVAAAWRLIEPMVFADRPLGLAFPNSPQAWSVGMGLADLVETTGGSFRVLPHWAWQVGAGHTGPAKAWIDLVPIGQPLPPGSRSLGSVTGLDLAVSSAPPAAWA